MKKKLGKEVIEEFKKKIDLRGKIQLQINLKCLFYLKSIFLFLKFNF